MAGAAGSPFASPRAPGGGARLVICSSIGASESAGWIPGFMAWLLKHPLADHTEQEAAVRASALPFAIVRPTGLADGPPTSAGVRVFPTGAMPSRRVARADVARFMLRCVDSGEFLGKAVSVCEPE